MPDNGNALYWSVRYVILSPSEHKGGSVIQLRSIVWHFPLIYDMICVYDSVVSQLHKVCILKIFGLLAYDCRIYMICMVLYCLIV